MASLSYYFVEPGSWTWNQIWAKFDDPLEECPESREVWQYMGSVKAPGKPARHEFRHRHHPVTKARAFRYVHGPHDEKHYRGYIRERRHLLFERLSS